MHIKVRLLIKIPVCRVIKSDGVILIGVGLNYHTTIGPLGPPLASKYLMMATLTATMTITTGITFLP
jgi:hypothetical protein